eukprot:1394906-Alexandrium_andersonii.AAC.1
MSASLVGSEMCIRDRCSRASQKNCATWSGGFPKEPQPKAPSTNTEHSASTAALMMTSAFAFARS